MITERRLRRALLSPVVATCLSCLALTACSGGDDEKKKGDTEKSSDSASRAVDPAKVSPEDLPDLPQVRGAKGALEDVTFDDCATKTGTQKVGGEVQNPGDAAVDYAIVVSWTNDTSDVLARGVAVVRDLGPDESESFEVKATVPDGVTQCTYFVQRGRVA